jgi:pantoate--beta-alanine ligase
MIQSVTRAEVRAWTRAARAAGERTALVPTMGYLHEGHLSLMRLAREAADRVALSIFVNPLQFGPTEDLDRYPRDLERDLQLARDAGADLVFTPSVAEMYPGGEPWVVVLPERGADVLDGAARPGHFRGVLTVVAKLFGIFTPDVALFGQKDYQQLTLIRRMVADLDMGVQVLAAPIVREADGLAMSSRNTYLTPDQRRDALALHAALKRAEAAFAAGERDASAYRTILRQADGPGVALEYAELVDPETLAPVQEVRDGTVAALAGRVGNTRLIDNTILGG